MTALRTTWALLSLLMLASVVNAQQTTLSMTAPAPIPTILLKQDTPVQLKLAQNLSNKTDVIGAKIELMLDQDLAVDGTVIARKGARALGKITEGKANEGWKKGESLSFELLYLKVGPVRVPLTGQMSGAGHRDAGKVVASTIAFGVGGLVGAMSSPKDYMIPEGTLLTGYIAQNTQIPVSDNSNPNEIKH